jgi:RNA polymerase-binding transcription factor DksA
MADVAYIGNDRADELLADALADHRRKVEAEKSSVVYTHCVECGDDMPEARKAIGACRCVDCQREYEHEQKRALYRGETQ